MEAKMEVCNRTYSTMYKYKDYRIVIEEMHSWNNNIYYSVKVSLAEIRKRVSGDRLDCFLRGRDIFINFDYIVLKNFSREFTFEEDLGDVINYLLYNARSWVDELDKWLDSQPIKRENNNAK